MAASAANLVARVSWVFGPGRPAFPEWIIDQACAKKELTLPGDKTACPTYTSDLTAWLDALVFDRPDGPASGIFNLCNSDSCTWRDWGQFCIDTAREAGRVPLALVDWHTGQPKFDTGLYLSSVTVLYDIVTATIDRPAPGSTDNSLTMRGVFQANSRSLHFSMQAKLYTQVFLGSVN